jgi:hypothetical protein
LFYLLPNMQIDEQLISTGGLKRPLVPHPYVAPPDKDQLITAVSQKSLEWKYEEEWRLLINVTHLRGDQDPANTNLYLPIPQKRSTK